jgi:segregation and condensation protein B
MDLKFVVESILFTSQKPLNPREIKEILSSAADKTEEEAPRAFKKTKEEEIERVLIELEGEHTQAGRSYTLACVAGSWQFVARPEYMPWLKALYGVKSRPPRLSAPALETLAIVAYRQPITRAEIEQIRGVAVDGVVATLLERGLLESAGRAEVVGRPMTYATTRLFLEYFGLRSLDELPEADELRRIPVEKPESLLTAETEAVCQGETAGAPGDNPGQSSENPRVVELGTSTESSAASAEPTQAVHTESRKPESDS